jgi:geranylgeranyl diphosphate synthase type II
MDDNQTVIEQRLNRLTWQKEPANLYEPIAYMLSQKGKRIRPHLCLLSAALFGGKQEDAIYPAIAFEMLHNFTLIHDDIMDHAALRRGKETIYQKWNTSIAILSGDTLFAKSYQYLLQYQGNELFSLLSLLTNTSIEICEGQQLDLDFECRQDVSIAQYLEMIRLKTAVMLASCLQAGAIVSSATEKDRQLIYDFGIRIGLAFQIKDDILDVYTDVCQLGKNIGGDIAENKKTYLSVQALNKAQGDDLKRLQTYFASSDFDQAEKFADVKAIYDHYQIKEDAQNRIKAYYEQAFLLLQQIDVREHRKQPLIEFVTPLIDRNY